MVYALVPDGYALKKVSKQQKEAVDKHNSNEAVQALMALRRVNWLRQ